MQKRFMTIALRFNVASYNKFASQYHLLDELFLIYNQDFSIALYLNINLLWNSLHTQCMHPVMIVNDFKRSSQSSRTALSQLTRPKTGPTAVIGCYWQTWHQEWRVPLLTFELKSLVRVPRTFGGAAHRGNGALGFSVPLTPEAAWSDSSECNNESINPVFSY